MERTSSQLQEPSSTLPEVEENREQADGEGASEAVHNEETEEDLPCDLCGNQNNECVKNLTMTTQLQQKEARHLLERALQIMPNLCGATYEQESLAALEGENRKLMQEVVKLQVDNDRKAREADQFRAMALNFQQQVMNLEQEMQAMAERHKEEISKSLQSAGTSQVTQLNMPNVGSTTGEVNEQNASLPPIC